MLENVKEIRDSDLESVSGGVNNIMKGNASVGKGDVRDDGWKCPKCGGNRYTITMFEDDGSKIECTDCHYSIYG